MATTFPEIQSTVRDIVKASAPFKTMTWTAPDTIDNHIFSEDGKIREAVEDSLKLGWVVVVSPPIIVTTKSQVTAAFNSPADHGSAKVEVLTVITIRTNPKTNTGPITGQLFRLAAIDLYSAIATVAKGVLSWKPATAGESGFTLLTERPAEPDFEDVGNFTYDIRVLKSVPL